MPPVRLSRREVLEKGVALGVIGLAAGLTPAAIAEAWENPTPRPPTPRVELGPFFKRGSPSTSMLRIAGEPGLPLAVSGAVFGASGQQLADAAIEVWHTDHRGLYDLDGYGHRAHLSAASDGKYAFDSILPGHYPSRVCQHVHYLITAPGYRPLSTQLYFATDPVFEGDPGRNYTRDPIITSLELVRPVLLAGDPADLRAMVTFDLVLERA